MKLETRPRLHENLLLSALPKDERERLNPFLHPVYLEAGHPITNPGEPIENVYFPFGAVTSTVQELSDGSSIETGLMGIEGLAGVQIWLGQHSTSANTFVQIPGDAHRMSTDDFIREVREKPSPLNTFIATYVHAFLVMTSFTAACNRLHFVDQRLCRWLRMSYNRANRTEFPLRHEFLAQMLAHSVNDRTSPEYQIHSGLDNVGSGRLAEWGFGSFCRQQATSAQHPNFVANPLGPSTKRHPPPRQAL